MCTTDFLGHFTRKQLRLIRVSFLEYFEFCKHEERIRDLLGPALNALYNDHFNNEKYKASVQDAQRLLSRMGRLQTVDREFITNFIFGHTDTVVVLGQDGLVANVLKYLNGQSVVGVNPDPDRWEGVLLPFSVPDLTKIIPDVFSGSRPIRKVTMAKAELNNGQTLYGVNDLFIGPKSHTSARYELQIDAHSETHSSSGIIVSTGLGSTGWFRSILAGATGIASHLSGKKLQGKQQGNFDWDLRRHGVMDSSRRVRRLRMIQEETVLLFSEETIQKRVDELGRQISADYSDVDELLMVGVLRGCYIFLADLSRRLSIPRRIDFISVSSYEQTKTTPGALRLIMDTRTDVAGIHVLLVDDILDTGHTLAYLLNILAARKPASLKSCVFLRKRNRLEKDVQIDYLGFDIPDLWVVGYGLDYADKCRALPYIGVVKTEQD